MIELIIGAVIGTLVSIAIAEVYHRRSSKGLREEIDSLRDANKSLSESVEELNSAAQYSVELGEIIRKHAVAGTPDDPDFPYK
jgi:gas vesicle protein